MKRTIPISFFLFPLTLLAADFPLIKEGKVALQIEHTTSEIGTTQYAAQELRGALLKMAEGEVTIAPFSKEATPAGPRVVIGAHTSLPAEVQAALKLEGKSEDEVLVQEHNGTLWITGPTERAALYATYTLLDEAAGVRWLWPGESGTRIPRHRELALRDAIRQAPDMPYRNLSLVRMQAYDDDTHIWMARQRMNVANITPWRPDETRARIPRLQELGYLLRMGGHSVVLPRTTMEKHPEYMALVSGVRRSFHHHAAHLCWSNPDVQRELKAEMVKWVDRFPEMDIATLYVSDHDLYCQCEGCAAMGPNITTRWQELSKIIIPPMRERNPKLKFWSLAYLQYRPVPETVAPYDHIQYTTSDVSYRHLLSSGSTANKKGLDSIKGWQAKGMNMGLRQYEMIGLRNPDPFMPLVSYMADMFTYAKANNLTSYASEITPMGYPDTDVPEEQHWNVNRMNVYAAARAMWDSTLTGEAIVHDWATTAYDLAAPAMEKYYFTMEKAWRESPQPISHYFNDASTQVAGFIYPTLIDRAETALQEALRLAAGIADREKRREVIAAISLDERMLGVWRRLYRNATPEGDPSIYRLLPYDKASGANAWSTAPVASLTTADGKDTGVTAQMLGDDGALRVRWQSGTALTVRLHSVSAPGEALEVAMDAKGKATTARLAYGEREELEISAEVTSEGDAREVTIRSAEAGAMLEKFNRLYVSLHSANESAQWPTAPMPYGSLPRTSRPTPRMAFIDSYRNANNGVHQLLRLAGWESHRTLDKPDRVLPHADVAILNYRDGKNFPVPEEEMRQQLAGYFERGGILIVSAGAPFPIKTWLNDEALGFRRVGEAPTDVLRRFTQTTRPGDWLSTPNELKFWRSGTTPYFGFAPEHPERWTSYATIAMKDGQEVPWLMATRAGKGWLVVTSEGLGYGGGWSIFGDRFNERLGLFIENLTVELKKP